MPDLNKLCPIHKGLLTDCGCNGGMPLVKLRSFDLDFRLPEDSLPVGPSNYLGELQEEAAYRQAQLIEDQFLREGTTLFLHPDDEDELTKQFRQACPDGRVSTVNNIPVVTSPYMERGKAIVLKPQPAFLTEGVRVEYQHQYGIKCPDGKIRPRKGFTYRLDRFTILEESDLPWLLHLGILQEIKPPMVTAMGMDMAFGPKSFSARSIIRNTVS